MRAVDSRPSGGTASRSDLMHVLFATTLSFALASVLELREKLAAWLAPFEAWELDEIPLALIVLSAGLAWYAWRRRGEAAALLDHNRELAQQLIAAQENERVALARELHDELAQHCTLIRLEAAYIERAHDAAQIAAAAQRVAGAAEQLHESVRRLLRRLRPAELDELGLVAALQSLTEACESRSGVACRFEHCGELDRLGEAVDTTLYRVAQEALANVARHAQARHVRIALSATRDELALKIEDDGCGLDATSHTRGLGLLGASERAAALGGQLHASGRPGRGTCVSMRLPRGAAA